MCTPGATCSYRYAYSPTAEVGHQTLIHTNIATHVGCSSTDGIALRRYPELYPNANLDLARVSMDILLLWRYLESDPNVENVYDAHL